MRSVKPMIYGLSVPLLAALLCGGCVSRPLDYQSSYDNAFISPGMKFLGLPAAVQSTIRAQAGMAEILDIGRYETHDRTFYKVWFARSAVYPPLYIAPDGSVLNSDLTVSMQAPTETYAELAGHAFGTVSLANIPASVLKAIKVNAPTAEIRRIDEYDEKKTRVYEIQFRGPNAPDPIRVDDSGKILPATRR
jgi:hypothetical protein